MSSTTHINTHTEFEYFITPINVMYTNTTFIPQKFCYDAGLLLDQGEPVL